MEQTALQWRIVIEITSKDVENEIHKILKDYNIEFKNKLREEWKSRMGMMKKVKDYCLIVEIYVKESLFMRGECGTQIYLPVTTSESENFQLLPLWVAWNCCFSSQEHLFSVFFPRPPW